ncbi:MAG: hypothetical protein ALAOOOJD_04828 [bacterium]|nr:hypothetical protein [bacterium]
MDSTNKLKLFRMSGRFLIFLGLGVALYNWFVQHASAISPLAMVLMAAGVLTLTTVELINWVKTGSWRLK